MTFIWPTLFWIGLSAAAIPLAIHLLSRRRYRIIRWPSMTFLLRAHQRNRRRTRLEELLLLLLRCAAMALVGLLLARPFFEPRQLWGDAGAAVATENVFVLDDSMSMGYRVESGAVFDRAREALVRHVGRMAAQNPRDTLTVLAASRPDQPLLERVPLGEATFSEGWARLQSLTPTMRRLNSAALFDALREGLKAHPDALSAVIHVISDFQWTDWMAAPSGERPGDEESRVGNDAAAALEAPAPAAASSPGTPSADGEPLLAPWASSLLKERNVDFVLIQARPERGDNLAVTRVEAEGGAALVGAEAPVSLNLFRSGSAQGLPEVEDAQITIRDGVDVLAAWTAQLPATGPIPRQSVDIPLESAGTIPLIAEIGGDRLPADDRAYSVLTVREAVRVLIINGEPSSDSYEDEVHLLRAALAPAGPISSGNAVTVVPADALATVRWADFDLVFLCNVARLGLREGEGLEQFIRRGGGVVVTLGDQVDAAHYNDRFYRDGAGWLPCRIGGIIIADERPAFLALRDSQGTPLELLSGESDPFGLAQVPFFAYFECSAAPTDKTATLPESEAVDAAPRGVTVAAVFDGRMDQVAVATRLIGEGRCVLMAGSVDKEWNAWADFPTYVPFWLEAARWAARPSEKPAYVFVGEPVTVEFDEMPTTVQRRSPLAARASDELLTPLPGDAPGSGRVRWTETDAPGIHEFEAVFPDGRHELRHVVVELDPFESDLASAAESDLVAAMAGRDEVLCACVHYVGSPAELEDIQNRGRREAWPIVWAFLFGVLIVEQGLAFWFGRGH